MYPHLSDNALTKCIVWFYDGNIRTFYSFDKTHKRSTPEITVGLRRFDKMLMQHFKGRWETAIIYENKYKGTEIAKYKNGVRVF